MRRLRKEKSVNQGVFIGKNINLSTGNSFGMPLKEGRLSVKMLGLHGRQLLNVDLWIKQCNFSY